MAARSPRRRVLLSVSLGACALCPCLAARDRGAESLALTEEGGQTLYMPAPLKFDEAIYYASKFDEAIYYASKFDKAIYYASEAFDKVVFRKSFPARLAEIIVTEHLDAMKEPGICAGPDCPVDAWLAMKGLQKLLERVVRTCEQELEGEWWHGVPAVFGFTSKGSEKDADLKLAVDTLSHVSASFTRSLDTFAKTSLCPGLQAAFDRLVTDGERMARQYQNLTGQSLYFALAKNEDGKLGPDSLSGFYHTESINRTCFAQTSKLGHGTPETQEHMVVEAEAVFEAAAVLLQDLRMTCGDVSLRPDIREVSKCVPSLHYVLFEMQAQHAVHRAQKFLQAWVARVDEATRLWKPVLAALSDGKLISAVFTAEIGSIGFLVAVAKLGSRVAGKVPVRDECVSASGIMKGLLGQ